MTVIRNSFGGDALQAGQLWIGAGTDQAPAAAHLTAGSNISITNAVGSITINSTPITWNAPLTGPVTMVANNGYVGSFTYNPNINATFGDMYTIIGGSIGFTISAVGSQTFLMTANAGFGTTLTTATIRATITLVCVGGSGSFAQFIVLNSEGTFVLS